MQHAHGGCALSAYAPYFTKFSWACWRPACQTYVVSAACRWRQFVRLAFYESVCRILKPFIDLSFT